MWLHVRSAGNWSLKLYNYFQDVLQSELKEVCVDKGMKNVETEYLFSKLQE